MFPGLARSRRPAPGALASIALAATMSLAVSACTTSTGSTGPGGSGASAGSEETQGAAVQSDPSAPAVPKPTVTLNVDKGASGVAVDTAVNVKATDGTLKKVTVSSPAGAVPGALNAKKTSWSASEMLEPGATYDVTSVAAGADGATVTRTSSFSTQALTLDQQTYPSVAPLQGETVGVGMPVAVSFDVAVTDRAAFEKKMTVTTVPQQAGSWHWLNDNTAHWRPKSYWEPGTKVDVDVDVNGVAAGNGIYGQEDRQVDFTVGDAHIYRVDAQTDEMKVFSNGSLLRTIPITTGKPGFETRSGTKVILEKFESKTMNSETIGIANDSAEGYNLDNVQYAMRLTYSGEFIHAAPWSVAYQGSSNVSHGCTGMSTADAGWLFNMTRRGDVVEYTGTDRQMEFDNGYGDWTESYATYKEGSALS